MSAQSISIWRERHRFCADTPTVPIGSLDEARFVLDEHGSHGSSCIQFHAALDHVSAVGR